MSGIDEDAPRRRTRLFLAAFTGVLTAAVILALVLMLNSATRERDAALGWQEHSYEAMILARTLEATIGRSEATLGRFVISGEKNFGRLYFDDWRRAGTIIERLDRQVDDAETQSLIDELRTVYAARGEELAAVALRTNYGQNPQALSKYYDAGRSPNVRRISSLLDQIIDGERSLLTQRTRAADATTGRSNLVGSLLSGVGIMLALGAALLGWIVVQSFAQRRSEERRNRELELAVDERTVELSEANARLREEMVTREKAEEQLRQIQKIEAVGQLTGGIAHDFNNMLAVVIGGLEMAQRRLGTDDVGRHLMNAMEGANRAAALTKRLLAFARAEPLLPTPTDPSHLVADMSELLDRSIGDTIEVCISSALSIWPIFVDRHQLENAILNLAVNARDAMENGGVLTIATTNVTLAEGEVPEAAAGDYVCLSVTDTGVGMDRNTLERIFEPFFTTKHLGKGTGLGLSQIFGFVRQSAGAILVTSEPGNGTKVALYLPRHHTAAKSPVRRVAGNGVSRHPAQDVLLIEDDPRVLAATAEALAELGHRAISCNIAGEALAMLDDQPLISLVITDVLMPGLTGPQIVRAIRKTRPDIPILFVTGFSGDIDDSEAFGGFEVLRKPFTIATLGSAVDRALDNGRARPARAA